MGFETILFDIDGTLIDSRDMSMRILKVLFKRYRNEVYTEKMAFELTGKPTRHILETLSDDQDAVMKDCLNLSARFRKYSNFYPGIVEVLAALKQEGICIGAVTSQSLPELLDLRKYFQLDQYVQVWITADDVTHPKPHPESVLKAMKQLSATPESTLFIGDTASDMQAGKSAGVNTAAALWGAHNPDQLVACEPDFCFSHPSQILTALDIY